MKTRLEAIQDILIIIAVPLILGGLVVIPLILLRIFLHT